MCPYDPAVTTSAWAEPTWGEVDPDVFSRIVVVSPHFDDAAMGAGHLLASYPDTTVITVLGGRPPAYPDPPSDWDALGGFIGGDDVVAVRRTEDQAAMAVLESGYRWLEFSDHQYLAPEARPTPDDVAPVLTTTIAEIDPTSVFFPMGLANPDHVMVHEACLLIRAAEQAGAREWFCYEDHGYKHLPGMLAWRWPSCCAPTRGPRRPSSHVPDEELKRRAISCYTSQIPPLERDHALTARVEGRVPEQFWRLAPPPAGWEALADFI